MSENTQENEGLYSFTAPVMMTFPNLQEAKAVQRNGKAVGEPKFSANFEFPADHADLAAIKALALKLCKAKWPGRNFGLEASPVDANKNPKQVTFMFPFASGDKLADAAKAKNKDREFSRGRAVLTSRSKYEPRLSAIINGKLTDLEGDTRKANAGLFFSGGEVLAQINLVPYDGVQPNGVDGITAYLNMVLATGKGTKVAGGGKSAAETFKGYVGTTSQEDPTSGMADMDDEIPF